MNRVIVILLFVLLFVAIGWVAPVIYAANAPSSQIVEVHELHAEDTTTDAQSHTVKLDRTVHTDGSVGKLFIELYLVNEHDLEEPVEIDSRQRYEYFEQGRHEVVAEIELPEQIESGEYKYRLSIQITLVNGRVTRSFSYQSNTFQIIDTEPKDL